MGIKTKCNTIKDKIYSTLNMNYSASVIFSLPQVTISSCNFEENPLSCFQVVFLSTALTKDFFKGSR